MKFSIIFLIFLIFFPLSVFASTSVVALDMDSGRVLYQNNCNEKKLIASTTKIMTAIVTIENINLNKKIIVGNEILKMYGTSIYLEVGEKIRVKDLLYGLLLRSGNDAAVVLAKNVAGSEKKFVAMMNEKAKELGMKNTVFRNPHGLDEYTKNYSTAYDMALLSSYANNNQIYKNIVSTEKYECSTKNKTYLWYNRNKLLFNYKFCTGGKNGYTPSAGKSLVSTAKKGNLSITIVSLNDNDIYTTHESLYEKLFSNYKKYKIVDKKTFNIDKKLFASPVYLKKSFFYPLTEREIDKIKTFIYLDNFSKNRVGNINIFLKDEKIGSLPIFLKKEKKENFSFLKLIHNLFW